MAQRAFWQLLLQPSPGGLWWARGHAGSQAPILVVLQQVQPVSLAFAGSAQLRRPRRGRPRPEARLLGLDAVICGCRRGWAQLQDNHPPGEVSAWKGGSEGQGEALYHPPGRSASVEAPGEQRNPQELSSCSYRGKQGPGVSQGPTPVTQAGTRAPTCCIFQPVWPAL